MLGKLLSFMGMGTVEHANDVYQGVAGLRGDLPGTDMTWEVYGSYGRTQLTDKGVSGFASLARYQELMLAPNYGANYRGAYGTCTSGISPFGEINGEGAGQFGNAALPQVSADCIDYLNPYQTNTTTLEQNVIEGTLQGKAFDLPAGEARFAVGAAYRDNGFAYQPDRSFAPDVNFASDIIGQFGILPVSGSNNVKEGYVEMLLPILRNVPLVQALDINVAYRYSDYNHAGGASAYKADFSWQMIDPLRLRAAAISARCVRRTSSSSSVRRRSCSMPRPMRVRSNLRTAYGNTSINTNRPARRCRRCAAR